MLSLCLVIQGGMRKTPLGFCLRVIVNEKPLNLEKTTSSVLSVFFYKSMDLTSPSNYFRSSLTDGESF